MDTVGTGAATAHGNADASKSVIARVALQPRLTWRQKQSRPTPYGDTTPMPVIATRGERRTPCPYNSCEFHAHRRRRPNGRVPRGRPGRRRHLPRLPALGRATPTCIGFDARPSWRTAGRAGYAWMSGSFRFLPCTTACSPAPAPSDWSSATRRRHSSDRSTPGSRACSSSSSVHCGSRCRAVSTGSRALARAAAYTVQLAGMVLTIHARPCSTFFELAGVDQVRRARRHAPDAARAARDRGVYGFVRHPLYFAWVLMVFATPDMTATRPDVCRRQHRVPGDRHPMGRAQPRRGLRWRLRGVS